MRPEHVSHPLLSDLGARFSLAIRARWSPKRFLIAASSVVLLIGVTRVVLAGREVVAELGVTQSVVVARGDLPAGHTVGPDDVSIEHWPIGLIPAGAASRPGDAVGQVIRSPIAGDEPITAFRLGAGRHGLLPDERTVTLPLPLAPPPVEVGDAVELFAVAITEFDDNDQPFVRPASVRLTAARIAAVDERGITVIVSEAAVRVVLESLAAGTVEIVGRP